MLKKYKKTEGKDLIYQSYNQLLKEWQIHVQEIDIPTTYGSTHAILAGNPTNPPLLLFHGVGDNAAIMWIYNAKSLSEHFYLIAVDTMGGPGKSEPNENYFKNFSQLLWIDELFAHLKLERTFIAGVSNGAYLSQYYTIMRPERVVKSICMAGGVSHGKLKNPMLKMMKVFLPEALFPNDKNIKKLLRKLSGSNFKVFHENEAVWKHWGLLLKYFNNMHMSMHKYITFSDQQLEILREKTLFLIGDKDPLTYDETTVATLDNLKMNYKIVEDTGHGINHERADFVNQQIIAYFS